MLVILAIMRRDSYGGDGTIHERHFRATTEIRAQHRARLVRSFVREYYSSLSPCWTVTIGSLSLRKYPKNTLSNEVEGIGGDAHQSRGSLGSNSTQ